MYNKKIALVFMLGIVAMLSSCTKKGDTGPAGPSGPAGPTYTGAISGHVNLFDQYGSKVLTGLNGVQLSLNGGTAQNADATGYYIFGGTTTGTYNITANNSNYGATRLNNFQFLSDTLNRDIKLSAIPNFSPTAFTTYQTAAMNGDSLVLNFTADTRIRSCMVFVNSTAAVSNMPANYLLTYSRNIPANATRVAIVIPAQDLYQAGIASASTAFFAAYGAAVNDASAYEDLSTGKVVYTAVSTTPVSASAIVP